MLPVAARGLKADVEHSRSFIKPYLRGAAWQVLTVHDMTSFSHPQCHSALRRSWLYRRMVLPVSGEWMRWWSPPRPHGKRSWNCPLIFSRIAFTWPFRGSERKLASVTLEIEVQSECAVSRSGLWEVETVLVTARLTAGVLATPPVRSEQVKTMKWNSTDGEIVYRCTGIVSTAWSISPNRSPGCLSQSGRWAGTNRS